MSAESRPDFGEFAESAETLRGQRVNNVRIVRRALRRAGNRYPEGIAEELNDVTRALDDTLGDLDRAAEELRAQNEALSPHDSSSKARQPCFEICSSWRPAPTS